MTATFLADKSALARVAEPAVGHRVGPLLLAGELASCSIVDLEMLYSAKDPRAFESIQALRRASYERVLIEQADFDRAVDVMEALSRKSQHRGVAIPDLLIAAVAERAGLVVLHYDSDFDRIALVTEQRMEWVVPRGTIK
jgi:predicted nucleic acid-binding protein